MPYVFDQDRQQAVLHGLKILDTPREEQFDRLTRLSSSIFRMDTAIDFLDGSRIYLKSIHTNTDFAANTSYPASDTFCGMFTPTGEVGIVEDALSDLRFCDNIYVKQGVVRSYLGAPIFMEESLGMFCAYSPAARTFTAGDVQDIQDLANITKDILSSRLVTMHHAKLILASIFSGSEEEEVQS